MRVSCHGVSHPAVTNQRQHSAFNFLSGTFVEVSNVRTMVVPFELTPVGPEPAARAGN